MNKNILILHGWNASSEDHWFGEAKEYFEKRGFQVNIPNLPGNYFPQKEEWLKVIEKCQPDEDWILIGHSLGGVAILKYLEKSISGVDKVILIATPYDAMHFGALENFYEGGFDWKTIKKKAKKFEILNEENDPAIPVTHGQNFAKKLSGHLHIIRGYTHFHNLNLNFLEKLF